MEANEIKNLISTFKTINVVKIKQDKKIDTTLKESGSLFIKSIIPFVTGKDVKTLIKKSKIEYLSQSLKMLSSVIIDTIVNEKKQNEKYLELNFLDFYYIVYLISTIKKDEINLIKEELTTFQKLEDFSKIIDEQKDKSFPIETDEENNFDLNDFLEENSFEDDVKPTLLQNFFELCDIKTNAHLMYVLANEEIDATIEELIYL